MRTAFGWPPHRARTNLLTRLHLKPSTRSGAGHSSVGASCSSVFPIPSFLFPSIPSSPSARTATSHLEPAMADAAAPPTAELAAASISSPADLEPSISRTRIRTILAAGDALAGQRVVVGSWVKTGREQGCGAFAFLEVNDGSCPGNLQVMVDAAVHPLPRLMPTGTSVLVKDELKKPPKGTKQRIELHVERVIEVGEVDAAAYLLPKTKLTLKNFGDFVHLCARTNTVTRYQAAHRAPRGEGDRGRGNGYGRSRARGRRGRRWKRRQARPLAAQRRRPWRVRGWEMAARAEGEEGMEGKRKEGIGKTEERPVPTEEWLAPLRVLGFGWNRVRRFVHVQRGGHPKAVLISSQ